MFLANTKNKTRQHKITQEKTFTIMKDTSGLPLYILLSICPQNNGKDT